ncbi:MAG TPA: Rrf2 family transcriptional regulator [Candidatus Hydrogenedentes bacterium]|nr:Rrf2 family transcriptional regulator [Candidatus Hydrogenedentota bacterium]
MRVSKKTDYALRAIVALARLKPGQTLSLRHIARSCDIPYNFLQQIMLDLRETGWVTGYPGRDGGYELAIPPDSLTMGEIVRHFDGVLAPIGCVSITQYEPCSQESVCSFRRIFLDVRNHTARLLEATTLEDLVKQKPVENREVFITEFSEGAGI